jgi:hypothetical protein
VLIRARLTCVLVYDWTYDQRLYDLPTGITKLSINQLSNSSRRITSTRHSFPSQYASPRLILKSAW